MRSRHRSRKHHRKSAVSHIVLSHHSQEERQLRNHQAEEYFNEIAGMINQPVNDLIYQKDEEVPQTLFDEILGMIPENEIPASHHRYDDYTEDQLMGEVDKLSQELAALNEKIGARSHHENLNIANVDYIVECMVKRPGMDEQHKQDMQRIEGHLHIINSLVNQLSSWSSTRKNYLKITADKKLSAHEKVQALIAAAQINFQTCRKNRKVFFIRHFSDKASNIHAAIASININTEPVQISQPDCADSPAKR